MNYKISFFSVLLALGITTEAQRLNVGFQIGKIRTIVLKTSSNSFDKNIFSTKGNNNLGLGLSFNFNIDTLWSIQSGVGFQNKGYNFNQNDFQTPYAKGVNTINPTILAIEVPLTVRRNIFEIRHKNKIGIFGGIKLSWNDLFEMSERSHFDKDSKPIPPGDTLYSLLYNTTDWRSIFSPDALFGLDYTVMKNNCPRHRFMAFFQYGFRKLHQFDVRSEFSINNMNPAIVYGHINPKLAYVSLNYVYYPKSLGFFHKKVRN